MKILKIEIQNINSLKCEKPIVIDFESEHFKDVGLYAITGTTGAGKTTILDAITLALYHRVPRLNNSSTKVKDVVSYGADSAYVNVVFENNNNTYEAVWTIKMLTSKGAKLKKPTEEVRLNNYKTGEILAEKKTDVRSKIVEIIQLDYDQFLRSVMLAQGDFASFLSAKGVDKAKLLEQITGEKIYKKIGEAVLLKKSESKNKLRDIEASINDEILSEEQKEELDEEKVEIKNNLNNLESQLKENDEILKWYLKFNELDSKKQELKKQIELLDLKKQENKNSLEKLSLHKNALVFKDTIKEILRLEKEIIIKQDLVKEFDSKLKNLSIVLESNKIETEKFKQKLKEKETDIDNWLPKLETISKLDENLKNENLKKNDLTISSNSIGTIIEKLEIIKIDNSKVFNENITKINKIEEYLLLKERIPIIEKNYSTWNNKLTLISRNYDVLIKDNLSIENLLTNKTKFENDILKFQENEKTSNALILNIEKDSTLISEFLDENNIEFLEKAKNKIFEYGNNLNFLEKTSIEYSDKFLKFKTSEVAIKKLKITKIQLETEISETIKNVKNAKQSFNDYEIIHLQNIKINSFEEERKLLVKGESCKLCGSKEHPLIEHYNSVETDDSRLEFDKRKKNLENFEKQLQEKNISLATVSADIVSSNSIIDSISKDLVSLIDKAKSLNSEIEITDIGSIKEKLIKTRKEYKIYDDKIKLTRSKTKEKDDLRNELSIKTNELNNVKNEIIIQSEKLNNCLENIDSLKQIISNNKAEINDLQLELKPQFEDADLTLPEVKNISIFIKNIEHSIEIYNNKYLDLIKLKNEQSILVSKSDNNDKILSEKLENRVELNSKIETLNSSLLKLTRARVELLDKEISVEQKRLSITKIHKIAKQNFDESSSELIKLNNNKLDLDSKNDTYKTELIKYITELELQESSLSNNLQNSIFNTKDEVKNAILPEEKFLKIKKIKKSIFEKTIELETSNNTIQQDNKLLTEQKDFEINFEDVIITLKQVKYDIEKQTNRAGQISEKIKNNTKILEKNKTIYIRIEKQEKEILKWNTLMDIIGGNQYAFNNYVQRLTLQHLIKLANIHLRKLNKRYSLQIKKGYNLKKDDFLNFKLVDHFQADETRDVDTSSGGEKFLISLSLALGLSDLASQNVSIDSLFIDEGFGSLDSNTLETVISALETLQGQGKIIGVISHVESLKERIPTQIQVVKKSSGVSTVEIVL